MPNKDRRPDIHEKLCEILGSNRVYFQPPESLKLSYPCIVYKIVAMNTRQADNKLYIKKNKYEVIYVTPDAGDTLYDDILKGFEMSSFNRYYRSENLNHYAISIYY